MPDRVIYYAIIGELNDRESPASVFRRTYTEANGLRDELFSKDLNWERSSLLFSAERGDLQFEFVEIGEDEANRIVERIRAEVGGAGTA